MACLAATVLDAILDTTKSTKFCAVRSTQSGRLLQESHIRSAVAATRDRMELRRFLGGEVVVWLGMPPVLTPLLSRTCNPPAMSQAQLLLEQN